MKHKLLSVVVSVVAVAAIVAVGVLAFNHYKNYQNKKVQKDAQIAAGVASIEKQRESQLEAATAQVTVLKSQYNAQVAECQKGLVAYGKLSATIKAQTPAPVCGKTL